MEKLYSICKKAEYVNLFLHFDKKQLAIQKLNKIMGWDLEAYNYRIYGFLDDKENAMIFDLNDAKK